MTWVDLVAVYAAAVSTLLAIGQLHKWTVERKFISVQFSEFWDKEGPAFEIRISNRAATAVQLDYVAFSSLSRPKLMFWSYDFVNQISLSGVEYPDREKKVKPLDGIVLLPGQMAIGRIDTDDIRHLLKITVGSSLTLLKTLKLGVWVEHSQSDKPHICVLPTPELDTGND